MVTIKMTMMMMKDKKKSKLASSLTYLKIVTDNIS